MDAAGAVFNNPDLFSLIHKFYIGYCLLHTAVLLNKGCSLISKNDIIFKLSYEALAKKLSIGLPVTFITDNYTIEDLIFKEQKGIVFDDRIIIFNQKHINSYPTYDLGEYSCNECGGDIHEIICGWCGYPFNPRKKEFLDCKMYEFNDGDYEFCGQFDKLRSEIIRCKRKAEYLTNITTDKSRAQNLIKRYKLDEDDESLLTMIFNVPEESDEYANTPVSYVFEATINTEQHFGDEKMANFDTKLITVDFVKILQYDKDSLGRLGLLHAFSKYITSRGWHWILKHCEDYKKGTYKHKRKRY